MNTFEWISIILILISSMAGFFKLLMDIKKEIQAVRDKIIDISVIDLHIENKILKHHTACRMKRRNDIIDEMCEKKRDDDEATI